MAWELLAQGTKNTISALPQYENQVVEGQKARVDFDFVTPVPSFQVDALRNTLNFAGVNDLEVFSNGNTVQIFYRKDPWWLPVIIVAVLAIAILLIAWFFFREVVDTTGPFGGILFLLGGALIAGILAYSLTKNRRESS